MRYCGRELTAAEMELIRMERVTKPVFPLWNGYIQRYH